VNVGVEDPATVACALNCIGSIPLHTAFPLAVRPGYIVRIVGPVVTALACANA
jgi:hypothetical protein